MNDNHDVVTALRFDVELSLTGPIPALVNKKAAALLRMIADRLEDGDFEEGSEFVDVNDENGKSVGEIYVDYGHLVTHSA